MGTKCGICGERLIDVFHRAHYYVCGDCAEQIDLHGLDRTITEKLRNIATTGNLDAVALLKIFFHAYETDNRPPMDAITQARKLIGG